MRAVYFAVAILCATPLLGERADSHGFSEHHPHFQDQQSQSSALPTAVPTAIPTIPVPTPIPTTAVPTLIPTLIPTTEIPTPIPTTAVPTEVPTQAPTNTSIPTDTPIPAPSPTDTAIPTPIPSSTATTTFTAVFTQAPVEQPDIFTETPTVTPMMLTANVNTHAYGASVTATLSASATGTPQVQTSATATETGTPGKGNIFTHVPSLTQTPTQITATVSPTRTAVKLGNVQAGPRQCVSPAHLRSQVSTLVFEQKMESYVGSRKIDTRYWRVAFKAPDECRITVRDESGNIVRESRFSGNQIRIQGGRRKQVLRRGDAQAWRRTADLLRLALASNAIQDYREVVPGAWIPNRYELKGARSSSAIRVEIISLLVNSDVSAEFAEGARP